MEMKTEEHIKRHQELHHALDELLADYIRNNEKPKSITELTIFELAGWSLEQTTNPTE